MTDAFKTFYKLRVHIIIFSNILMHLTTLKYLGVLGYLTFRIFIMMYEFFDIILLYIICYV